MLNLGFLNYGTGPKMICWAYTYCNSSSNVLMSERLNLLFGSWAEKRKNNRGNLSAPGVKYWHYSELGLGPGQLTVALAYYSEFPHGEPFDKSTQLTG